MFALLKRSASENNIVERINSFGIMKIKAKIIRSEASDQVSERVLGGGQWERALRESHFTAVILAIGINVRGKND